MLFGEYWVFKITHGLFFAVLGVAWGVIIDSSMIIFDGLYSLISLFLSVLAICITRYINKNDFEKISFYNDSFQVQIYHNNQIAVSSTYAYTSITSITTTTSLYCFNIKLNKNYIIPIIKNSFIAGNESDFITFFKSKSLF